MPITATYAPSQFKVSVLGTIDDEGITLARTAAGALLVNGGSVPITGGSPTVANTDLLEVIASAGNDVVALDETNGALPTAELSGGDGDDSLTGGSGGDTLLGEADNDALFGRGGLDFLFGGLGNDTLTGGDGDDQMFGEDGNDRMIWNPGDDSDLMEGGNGSDTAEVNGGNGDEVFTVTANGTRVRFDRLSPAPFALDIGTTETLVVNANGGNDTISTSGSLSALISLTLDGGAGNDTILGGNGIDVLLGGDGNDFIDGNQGNDTAFLGAGDDVFQWDPGDGSDAIEGQAGTDRLVFNASAANEILDIAANGGRVRFTRNVGAIVMDLNDVESFTINALGGIDAITVNDLSGTDATGIVLDLAATIGGSVGDGLADTLTVNGSNGANAIDVTGSGTAFTVAGLAATIAVANSEGANDSLVVNGLGGDDSIVATTLAAGVVKLTLDGGAGNDTILASQGADVVFGGDGSDWVLGDNGNDTAFLGTGIDVFQWDPGDGSDVVEGQADVDFLLFGGSNASENINIAANGGRILFTRDVAAVTMDLDDVERVLFNAFGGADNIIVGDLSGTDATNIELRLSASGGGGDGAIDSVTVNGTAVADVVAVSSPGGVVTVSGLPGTVAIDGSEGANDRLTLNGLAGDDVINASALAAGLVSLSVNGGLGTDLIVGSAGADLVNGGDGSDTALLGAGDDVFAWNPGDDNDIVEGQSGTDTLRFNGANISENITITANGGRALFLRDVASVTMDLNDTEVIQFAALSGADTITVNDLSGTDVTQIAIDLAFVPGGPSGDSAIDTLTLNASDAASTIDLSGATGALLTVTGLPETVTISQFETSGVVDRLTVLAHDGNDSISAAGLTPHVGTLTIDGGAGDDLIRSNGDGTYLGGDGDDFIYAGLTSASETLDGGAGNDTLDTTTWGGVYTIDLPTGVTNFSGESFVNFENVVTGAGNDTITGTTGDNMISTQGGADTVNAGAGNDVVSGGAGADTLDGGADQDWLQGGAGTDTETGGTGNDSVWGEAGDDLLDGGAGDDTIVGGDGTDTVTYAPAGAAVTVDLSWLEDQNTFGGGWDTLVSIENAIGSALGDRLTGSAESNQLTGGAGADVLTGGDGNDRFVYLALGDTPNGAADLITDRAAGDLIDLSAIDADTVTGGNQAFHLGATAGHTGDIVLVFNAGTNQTSVSLFVNGDVIVDATILLSGNQLALGAADFVL